MVSYRVGRHLDLKANLRVTIRSVLGGAYFGSFLGQIAVAILIILSGSEVSLIETLTDLFSPSNFFPFFMVFTVLTLAHFRSHPLSERQFPTEGSSAETSELSPTSSYMLLLLFVAFLLGVVMGVLSGWQWHFHLTMFLIKQRLPINTIEVYLELASFTVSWITFTLVLLSCYWVGRKLNLKVHLRGAILSILFGVYLGLVLGMVVSYSIHLHEPVLRALFVYLYLAAGLGCSFFFEAFTALSLAFFRSH